MKNKYFLAVFAMLTSLLSFSQGSSEAPTANVQILQPAAICEPGDCTQLFAEYFITKPTTNYFVEPIVYQNLFSFDGGIPLVVTSDDQWSPTFTLPFTFNFYGQSFTKVLVGSNGVITFDIAGEVPGGTQNPGGTCPWAFNVPVPSTNFPVRNSIYGVYQDTNMGAPPIQNPTLQNVNYYVGGTAPNRYFVTNFNRLPQFQCNGTLGTSVETDNGLQTSQIVIYETTNIIDVIVRKRSFCATWNNANGVIGVQNQAGTAGIVPPGRNSGPGTPKWNTTEESWRFTPNGVGPDLVTLQWKNPAGDILGVGNPLTVCIADATEIKRIIAEATYVNGSVTAIERDDIDIQLAPQMPVLDPINIEVCNSSAPPYTVNVNQDTYILDGESAGDFEILYFTNQSAAEDEIDSQAIPNSLLSAFPILSTDPVTLYILIREPFGGPCIRVRAFTVQVGTPEGSFSYPDDNTPSTFCSNSSSALAPLLDELTGDGVYSVNPPTGLIIDPNTGVLNLTGAISGTYIINYDIAASTAPDGCAAFNTNTTVIIEACINTTVSNSGNVCEGTPTFSLFASYDELPGGTTTYEWRDNAGAIISTVQDPVGISVPLLAGAYTYSLIITQDGAASNPFTTVLTVYPLPIGSFVSTSSTICTGATGTIVFRGTPGASLQFTDGTNTYNITFDAAGDATFSTPALSVDTTYTLNTVTGATVPECITTILNASITISVGLPTATIVGFTDAVICSGTPTGLEIQGTPNATVSYTIDGVNQTDVVLSAAGFFTIPTGVQNVTVTTSYTYALTNVASNPCANPITGQSATLTVNALPTATIDTTTAIVCEGTSAILNFIGTPNAIITYNNGTQDITTTLNAAGTATVTTVVLTTPTTFTLVSAAVTNTVLCSQSIIGTVSITINDNPEITAQPTGLTSCINGSVTFTVGATGANLTYQWLLNGTLIATATDATYTDGLITLADAGAYTVVVSGSCGTPITSNVATLIITEVTIIATQPAPSTTVCSGQPINLAVTATGTDITYQWSLNGNTIAGATNPTLNIASATIANAGNYTVILTNSCQVVTSDNAVVIVNELPAIVTQPATSTTVCVGQPINLAVTATGTNLTYQWSLNGNAIAGAVASTYSDATVSFAEAGNYTVTVSGGCEPSVTSTAAIIVVNEVPTFITQPAPSTTVCVGQPINLAVTATGTDLTYQWFRGATLLTGATNPNLNIASATIGDAGTYTVVLTNSCQVLTSDNAVVIVNELPAIITQPLGTTICEGQGINLAVTATGTDLTYQWFLNGNAIVGAVASTYFDATVSLAEAGNYTVTVGGICVPSVTSTAAIIVVNQAATFTTQPAPSTTVCSGESVSLTAAAVGGTAVTYQWFRGTTAIAGATLPTYNIASSIVADSGNYTAHVTVSSCATIISNVATVTVNQAPIVTSQPQNQEICERQTATFTVLATGTNLTYQWFKGTTAIVGAIANTYSIPNAIEADSGTFYCKISNASCPNIQTILATLLVKPLPFATIAEGTPSIICEGESTQVVFNGTAGALVVYTINGGTQKTITLNAGGVATILPTGILDETTVYELVRVTYTGPNACSQPLSSSATITVNPLPSIALKDGFICIDPLTLATTRTYELNTRLNDADYTFEWFDANGTIPLVTTNFYDVSTVGQYGVTITDIVTGCQASAFANVDESSPPVDFTYLVNGFFANNPTVVINATPAGEYEYQLDFGPFQESNTFDNITAGVHTISVRDPQACAVLTKEVLIIDYPRYFTPNGDGINDTWNIPTINTISMAKIYIFDRFGKLIKEMGTSGVGWDGTYNGQLLPATDYWFTINYQEAGISKEFRAHFSMKR